MDRIGAEELELLVAEAVAVAHYDADFRPAAPAEMTPAAIAAVIDHTALKPDTTSAQIDRLCDEARQYEFASVCVNPTWVARCAERLSGSSVQVCTVVGFPLGATLPSVKAFEAGQAVANGATEVDMVINVGRLKDSDYATVYADIVGVVEAAHAEGVLVKVILETCLLTVEEKVAGCVLAKAAGVDFVKTFNRLQQRRGHAARCGADARRGRSRFGRQGCRRCAQCRRCAKYGCRRSYAHRRQRRRRDHAERVRACLDIKADTCIGPGRGSLLMARRVSDFALMMGHAWRCAECRTDLLERPELTWIGFKLSAEQRESVREMTFDSFQTVMRMAEATGLDIEELYEAIDHPRARLRHLGSIKGEYYSQRR